MERNDYISKARHARVKALIAGAWWDVKWKNEELVLFRDALYVPYRYIMDFDKHGNTVNLAELHDLKASSVVICGIEELEELHEQ